jgi:hypothetical protein
MRRSCKSVSIVVSPVVDVESTEGYDKTRVGVAGSRPVADRRQALGAGQRESEGRTSPGPTRRRVAPAQASCHVAADRQAQSCAFMLWVGPRHEVDEWREDASRGNGHQTPTRECALRSSLDTTS